MAAARLDPRKFQIIRAAATQASYRHGMGGRDRKAKPRRVPSLPKFNLPPSGE